MKILSKLIIVFIIFFIVSTILTIKFMVLKGEIIVPDLVGNSTLSALETLNKTKLNLKIQEKKYSSLYPENHIIYQNPRPGSCIKENQAVKVIVSKGKELVEVPDFINKSLETVKIELEHNKLLLNRISYVSSDIFPQDFVISQNPIPNISVSRNTKINLLISKGKKEPLYFMPNFIGEKISSIESVIQKFDTVFISYKQTNDLEPGLIINQVPKYGSMITKRDTIKFVLTSSSNKEEEEYVTYNYFMKEGNEKQRVKIVAISEDGEKKLFDELAFPTEKISVIVKKKGIVKIKVYLDEKLEKEEDL